MFAYLINLFTPLNIKLFLLTFRIGRITYFWPFANTVLMNSNINNDYFVSVGILNKILHAPILFQIIRKYNCRLVLPSP